MAEPSYSKIIGSSSDEKSSNDSEATNTNHTTSAGQALIDSSLTECPVCLECFRKPKSLPCLHTFCQQCLETFIEQEDKIFQNQGKHLAAFPCPTCRRITPPVDSTEETQFWAGRFPTNNLVLAVIQMSDLQINEKCCVPCQRKAKQNIAVSWCKNCDIYFCDECKIMHDLFFTTHTVIPMAEIVTSPAQTVDLKVKCEKHKEPSHLFCVDHSCLCCTTCIVLDHRKCDRVISASEHAQVLRENKDISKLEQKFSSGLNKIDSMISRSKDFLEGKKRDHENALKSMSENREIIVKSLNDLESKTRNEMQRYMKEKYQKEEHRIEVLTRLREVVHQSHNMFDAALSFGDDSMTVSEFMTRSREFDELYAQIEEIEVSADSKSVRNELIELIYPIMKISNIVRFPHLYRLRKTRCIGSFDHMATKCRITGLLYFKESAIFVVDDLNNTVSCYNEEGIMLSEITLKKKPWDICKVNDSTLAVSVPESRCIMFLRIPSLEIVSKKRIAMKPYGIACTCDIFLVTCPTNEPPKSCQFKLNGEVICQLDGESSEWHTTNYKHCEHNFAISRRVESGTVIKTVSEAGDIGPLTKVGMIYGPRGIHTDDEDNLYVCGTDSSNIVMVTPTGEEFCLLAEKDGIKKPCAISVLGEKFVVAEDYNPKLKIYQLG